MLLYYIKKCTKIKTTVRASSDFDGDFLGTREVSIRLINITVEWLQNRYFIPKKALISFHNVYCSLCRWCSPKKNIFSINKQRIKKNIIFYIFLLFSGGKITISKFWPKINPLRRLRRLDRCVIRLPRK